MCYTAIMNKDDVLNFRVPADLKAALRRAADQDERSMGTLAGRILREWLVENGYFKLDDAKPSRLPRKARR